MANTYIKSTEIELFPSGYRSQSYDKSKFTTEDNITKLAKYSGANNFVIQEDEYYIANIKGYIFKFKYTGTLPKYLYIKTTSLETIGNVLCNIDDSSTTLDAPDESGTYYFKGLAFTDDDITSTSGIYYVDSSVKTMYTTDNINLKDNCIKTNNITDYNVTFKKLSSSNDTSSLTPSTYTPVLSFNTDNTLLWTETPTFKTINGDTFTNDSGDIVNSETTKLPTCNAVNSYMNGLMSSSVTSSTTEVPTCKAVQDYSKSYLHILKYYFYVDDTNIPLAFWQVHLVCNDSTNLSMSSSVRIDNDTKGLIQHIRNYYRDDSNWFTKYTFAQYTSGKVIKQYRLPVNSGATDYDTSIVGVSTDFNNYVYLYTGVNTIVNALTTYVNYQVEDNVVAL